MKLIYDVNDRPPFGKLVVFSLQQLLAIITATIVVPVIIGSDVLTPAAALLGAGFGTICYLLFTGFKSPVFLGSSFAFIAPLFGAVAFGYFGVLLGAAFAAAVYIVLAVVIKFAGSKWVNKLMPPVVIGPTVALIGLSLAGNAMGDIVTASGAGMSYNLVALLCGLVTFFVIVFCSVQGNKTMKLIPFIIGIAAGYVLASLFSIIGYAANVEYLQIVNYGAFVDLFSEIKVSSFINYDFSFLHTKGYQTLDGAGVANIALLYIPVAFVVFAEHIADHKNISSIIGRDLITDPGLHRTLLGDGVGSFVGAIFGGIPNTTYGESIGCVAITRNASIVSILGAAVFAIVLAFCAPVIAFINTIPACVMGGVCLSLYGFIAVSGLNMLRGIDLGESKNLFVVCSILIAGIGGLTLNFGTKADGSSVITISSIATALILGILVNLFVKAPAIPEKGDSLPAANVEASKGISMAPEAEEVVAEEVVADEASEEAPAQVEEEVTEEAVAEEAVAEEVTEG